MYVKGNKISQRLSGAFREIIGPKIKARRKTLGMTLDELGKKCCFGHGSVSRERIRQIESVEESAPNIGSIYAIFAALEIEPADVLPSVKEVLDGAKIEMQEKVVVKKSVGLTYVGDMSKESNE